MEEFQLKRDDSLVLAVNLLYNFLDTEYVIENDVFYFSPYGEDESMPSLWLKQENIILYWYSDYPERGASSNVPSNAETAFLILDTIRRYYGFEPRGKEKKSQG